MVPIDPQSTSMQAARSGSVYVETPHGGELSLDPGREVVARVVSVEPGGAATINLAGQNVQVTTATSVQPGDQLRLSVTRADSSGVRLSIVPSDAGAAAAANVTSLAERIGAGGSDIGTRVVSELARSGVAVTPNMAATVQQVAERLGADVTAARAAAALAGRGLSVTTATAARVVAAMNMAGSLGSELARLAEQSPAVANALPTGAPTAATVRALVEPTLRDAELAIARIATAQSDAAAPAAATTASGLAALRSYASSQIGGALVGSASGAAATANVVTGAGTAAGVDVDGALHGRTSIGTAASGARTGMPLTAALDGAEAGRFASTSPSTGAAGTAAQGAVRIATNAATASIGTTAQQTAATTAQAIADMAALTVQVATALAPNTGAAGAMAAQLARGVNSLELAQEGGEAGSIGASSASVAGHAADGVPVPLITALQSLLKADGAEQDTSKILRALSGATSGEIVSALRGMPEATSLKIAGELLRLMPGAQAMSDPALADLRMGIHAALDRLGQSLRGGAGAHDAAALRHALEQVAASDPRPAVAADAARLLAAVDGQQLLSRPTTGPDPGYVYFQVPLPNGSGAEVMVRRDANRRAITFDDFSVAFLLDTQHLGSLMIQLDANPSGIRADVKTSVPALETFITARADQLVEPLAREARRPVTVTTGTFDDEPPTSLLDSVDSSATAIQPGRMDLHA